MIFDGLGIIFGRKYLRVWIIIFVVLVVVLIFLIVGIVLIMIVVNDWVSEKNEKLLGFNCK